MEWAFTFPPRICPSFSCVMAFPVGRHSPPAGWATSCHLLIKSSLSMDFWSEIHIVYPTRGHKAPLSLFRIWTQSLLKLCLIKLFMPLIDAPWNSFYFVTQVSECKTFPTGWVSLDSPSLFWGIFSVFVLWQWDLNNFLLKDMTNGKINVISPSSYIDILFQV